MPTPAHILLVEDDADTRLGLAEILTSAGYSVLTAENGQQALDLLDSGIRPRLMLIDLIMPKVSGTDLLTYLHGDPELRHIPTVIMTGVARDSVRSIADAILIKPLSFQELLTTVHRLTTREPRVPLS